MSTIMHKDRKAAGLRNQSSSLGEVEVAEVDGDGLHGDGADAGAEAHTIQMDEIGGTEVEIAAGGNVENMS